jgi:hypothetical protein
LIALFCGLLLGYKYFWRYLTFTFSADSLQDGLYVFAAHGCVATPWNGMAIPVSLRLALHLKNHTLHPVQLPDLG